MRPSELLLTGLISAALAVAAPKAETSNSCPSDSPTAESYTWNFPGEATSIFRGVEADAHEALKNADELESFTETPQISWQGHALELADLRTEVNDMGAKLCRLESIRRVVAPWQQKTIDDIASSLRLMADNTEDAIQFLNSHHQDLWSPTYRKYLTNLFDEAHHLTKSTQTAVHYESARDKYRNLRNELGVSGS